MFFNNLENHSDNIAVHDEVTNVSVTYQELENLVRERTEQLGDQRKLVFIEARNSLKTVVDYLSCLRGQHVVYLLESLDRNKTQSLIQLYKPNILIGADGAIQHCNDKSLDLHEDLALLLSTSGSTGSPKFVKLSQKNIQSNAEAICEYLELDNQDRALSHLKLHYSYGISILNSHLQAGASVILTSHTVMDDGFWKVLDQYGATSFAGVPYTFEMLLHNNFAIEKHPSLRYVTQAGGKLEASLVKQFAEQLGTHNVQFFVMYGQTEAAPRISYLPPDFVLQFPGSIGKAIPGGKLFLIDEQGSRITAEDEAGELVYAGPNVMMGYATSSEELASDETPEYLLTGDIACRMPFDFYYIVGRTSRFVKPFGIRVNLDDVQSYIKTMYAHSAVTGDDKCIIIALKQSEECDVLDLVQKLSQKYDLPETMFSVRFYEDIPLLPSGKYDYKAILVEPENISSGKPSLLRRVLDELVDILALKEQEWETILALYQTILASSKISVDDTFNDLAADSLSFVSLSIELENVLGADLPIDWADESIRALDVIFSRVKFG
ncbi:MAG: hypothetical protein COA45_12030 [Zetaproteobacteria bacterium]|nr:MAG: hypothetical protein COA45_12030 [Zetaproteobacteria bacterium]